MYNHVHGLADAISKTKFDPSGLNHSLIFDKTEEFAFEARQALTELAQVYNITEGPNQVIVDRYSLNCEDINAFSLNEKDLKSQMIQYKRQYRRVFHLFEKSKFFSRFLVFYLSPSQVHEERFK